MSEGGAADSARIAAMEEVLAAGLVDCLGVWVDISWLLCGVAQCSRACHREVFGHLSCVDLEACSVGANDGVVARLAKRLPSLRRLSLQGCSFVSDDSVKDLSGLSALNLCGCDVSDASVTSVVRTCPALRSLDLSSPLVTDVGLTAVGRARLEAFTLMNAFFLPPPGPGASASVDPACDA